MKNLKISIRLFIGFAIVIVCTLFLSIVGIYNLSKTDSSYRYLFDFPNERLLISREINEDIDELRRLSATIALFTGDSSEIDIYEKELKNTITKLETDIERYKTILFDDPMLDSSQINSRSEIIEELLKASQEYMEVLGDPVVVYARAGDIKTAKQLPTVGASVTNNMLSLVSKLVDTANIYTSEMKDNLYRNAKISIIIMIFIFVVAIILSILIAFLISKSIVKPIKRLLGVTEDISQGNLNVNLVADSKDEIGILAQGFLKMCDIIKNLMDNLNGMELKQIEGDIDAFLNPDDYPGVYGEVASSVNSMVSAVIKDTLNTMDVLNKIIDGDFDATLPQLPGKKIILNNSMDNLRNNMKLINTELSFVINSAVAGDLTARIDVTKYKGDWKELMDSVNKLLLAFIEPIEELEQVMDRLSSGDFSQKIEGNYKGEFLKVKDYVNSTVDSVSFYIDDISSTLNKVANQDLTTSITQNYIGDYMKIKESINRIIQSLHKTMSDINTASSQVNAGARNISDSSTVMATGATEQAASLQELTSSVERINSQTSQNVENTRLADELSQGALDAVILGDKEMGKMLESMEGIETASNNISSIIKTIDDISFQTNLLALNAAVEAARAGVHGKGFTVVAEEVGNLATRSQVAAKETAKLIEESISKVESGKKISQSTANALKIILEDVNKVLNVISDIAVSSEEQAEEISQITLALTKVSEVVQNNSATSEEAAATAEELSTQSEILNDMVSRFTLN